MHREACRSEAKKLPSRLSQWVTQVVWASQRACISARFPPRDFSGSTGRITDR